MKVLVIYWVKSCLNSWICHRVSLKKDFLNNMIYKICHFSGINILVKRFIRVCFTFILYGPTTTREPTMADGDAEATPTKRTNN